MSDESQLRPPTRITALSWQWVETSQRVYNMMRRKYKGEKRAAAPVAAQTMMQNGAMVRLLFDDRAILSREKHPYLVRGMLLERQSADYLVDGAIAWNAAEP